MKSGPIVVSVDTAGVATGMLDARIAALEAERRALDVLIEALRAERDALLKGGEDQ